MLSLPSGVQQFAFSNTQLGYRTALRDGTIAELLLQGAHVLHWQPAGHRPVLWLSHNSYREAGRPVRGGIPICFPWFGPHPSDNTQPAHGSARISPWQLVAVEPTEDNDEVELRLTCQLEPFAAEFRLRVGRELKCSLEIQLPPQLPRPATFEAALHTYLAVSDIRSVEVSGLETVPFLNKVPGQSHGAASGVPITFSGETDRVYQQTEHSVQVTDRGWQRAITISKSGSQSTVVWNPWIDKSQRMPDFGDHEWTQMLCVETANVGDCAVTLQPGQSHTMHALIAVRHL